MCASWPLRAVEGAKMLNGGISEAGFRDECSIRMVDQSGDKQPGTMQMISEPIPEFFVISTSIWGQDAQQTLHHAIMPNRPLGAEGGHFLVQ